MTDILHNLKVPRSETAKFAAAWRAVEMVEDGMQLGLGTGSTAYWFVVLLARRMKLEGIKVVCVTTSSKTAELAGIYDVPVISLDDMLEPEIVIDGADEISPNFELIKGGGGALLQEKIVANAADRMIVIADESKYVDTLGKFHLPVEVVKFGWKTTARNIVELLEDSDVKATRVELRKTGLSPFVSDEGHYILDCYCEQINDPGRLSVRLNLIPGVVENGLFIGLADTVILGRKDGTVQVLDRDDGNGEFEPLNLPIDLEFDEES